jgi:hypothetical protein
MPGRASSNLEPIMTTRYAVVAAAVPGALGAAVLAAIAQEQARFVANCVSDTIGVCLGYRYPVLVVGPLVVTVVVWLALRAVGERDRALPAALLGACATAGGLLMDQATHTRWIPPSVWFAVVVAAVGFGAGAAVATARLPMAVRIGLVLVLLAPLGAFAPLRKQTRHAALRANLERVDLPLFVSRVEGYRVGTARADVTDRVVSVSMVMGPRWVSLHVIPLPADFTPPLRCGPTAADIVLRRKRGHQRSSLPCRPVGTDHWIRDEAGGEVHLVRRGDALVLVSPTGGTPAADVATAATTLTEVTADRLAELGTAGSA